MAEKNRDRVQKILAHAGVDSRRKCEELIAQGRVTVNGTIIKLGDSANPYEDDIRLDGEKIQLTDEYVYLMMNKPPDYITTVSDSFERKKVVDLIPEQYAHLRLYPVGRLDRDAEGLLLLTNDGLFANRVMHPRYEIPKTYRIWLDGNFEAKHKATIESGVHLDDGWVKQMKVKIIDRQTIELTLSVGKHKIVKRICQHLGYRVKRLLRIRIGKLEMHNMKSGQVRELSVEAAEKIFE
ncbi:MAG TPA: pseudouridine synthase [Acidobacteriota bacterium]|nr:pseudouridine synthase [Acidobacteriota bacterium]